MVRKSLQPVWLKSNFEVSSELPGKFLHPVQLVLLLDGQVVLLEGVAVQVEQVQLPLLKGQGWIFNKLWSCDNNLQFRLGILKGWAAIENGTERSTLANLQMMEMYCSPSAIFATKGLFSLHDPTVHFCFFSESNALYISFEHFRSTRFKEYSYFLLDGKLIWRSFASSLYSSCARFVWKKIFSRCKAWGAPKGNL